VSACVSVCAQLCKVCVSMCLLRTQHFPVSAVGLSGWQVGREMQHLQPSFVPANARPQLYPCWSELLIAQIPGKCWVHEQLRDMFISF
jgi:hypothetical protein